MAGRSIRSTSNSKNEIHLTTGGMSEAVDLVEIILESAKYGTNSLVCPLPSVFVAFCPRVGVPKPALRGRLDWFRREKQSETARNIMVRRHSAFPDRAEYRFRRSCIQRYTCGISASTAGIDAFLPGVFPKSDDARRSGFIFESKIP